MVINKKASKIKETVEILFIWTIYAGINFVAWLTQMDTKKESNEFD